MKKLQLLFLLLFSAQIIEAQAIIQKKANPKEPTRNAKTKTKAKVAAAGGNVGIGITTPLYPLHVDTEPGYSIVNTSGPTSFGTYLDVTNAWLGTNSDTPLLFYVNNNPTPNLFLAQNGNFGINKASPPSAKLHVNGNAIISETDDEAEQILIGTNIPNNEAKLYIVNRGFPNAVKIDGSASTSGDALHVIGNTLIKGDMKVKGNLTKGGGTFQIDHPQDPLNKYLYHSFVESPDMMNVYNGNTTTDANGDATVQLPAYFEALNMDYRYQLTPIGAFAQAIVLEKVRNNAFKIKTDKPNLEVSWQVTGVRNDAYARKNRVQVEVAKPVEEKGKYLHPEAFGHGSN